MAIPKDPVALGLAIPDLLPISGIDEESLLYAVKPSLAQFDGINLLTCSHLIPVSTLACAIYGKSSCLLHHLLL